MIRLSTEKFFIADPYNEKHIQLFEQFENKHNISTAAPSRLKEIASLYSKTEYQIITKESNNVEQILFLESDGSIVDTCHIQGEKDIKTCTLYFSPINILAKNRPLLTLSLDYAFNVLGMEEIFVATTTTDKNLRENLESRGFENLGEDGGNIIFLKEKEIIQKTGRIIQ